MGWAGRKNLDFMMSATGIRQRSGAVGTAANSPCGRLCKVTASLGDESEIVQLSSLL